MNIPPCVGLFLFWSWKKVCKFSVPLRFLCAPCSFLDYCVCDRCIDIKTERFQAVQESAQYRVVEQQKQKVQPVRGREIGNRASTQAPLSQQKE